MIRRTHLRPVSARRALALREYAKIKRIWFAQPENLLCKFPACQHATDDPHHSRGRANALLNDVRYWIPLCRWHHDWVKQNPVKARDLGMLCQVGFWNSPHHD